MRKAFLKTISRRLAPLLALPLLLAAAPLCEACPANTDTAVRAPSIGHAAAHACCEKKPQIKQMQAKEQCENCIAKPHTPGNVPDAQVELHLSQTIHSALPASTLRPRKSIAYYTASFSSLSPPAVYLMQRKILV